MFSIIVGSALASVAISLERPLERIEAALAVWAGHARGEPRKVVSLDIEVSGPEFRAIASNVDIRRAMVRAEILKDAGEVPTCGCCGAVAQ